MQDKVAIKQDINNDFMRKYFYLIQTFIKKST